MIFETQEEKDAFKFVCEIADEALGRRGCNDLSEAEDKAFGHLQIERQEMPEKTIIKDNIRYDFDVLHWLKRQVKNGTTTNSNITN